MVKRAYGLSWTIAVGAIATLSIEPVLAESLTPLPEGDPVAIGSTSAAALMAEPEIVVEPPSLPLELNRETTPTVDAHTTRPANIVPYAEVAAVVDSAEEAAPSPDTDTEPAIAQAQPIVITNVQIEETADGFSLQLEADGELATPETSVTGNAAIADIPNAILQLPDGDEFFASNPTDGISLINVTSLPDNQVRIAITGTDAAPVVNISVGVTGLIVSGSPGDPTVAVPDDESIQVVVTGEQADDDYFVPNASTGTRTDTPLRDIPNSIQVIPQQVIEDQQATGIEDVVTNAAGVSFLGNNDNRELRFSIRGFDNAPILRDGFLLPFGATAAAPEVANLERIEVLRGPASVLYGQAQPGGVINLVTEQPLSDPYYNLQLQVGNRGFVSPSIDLSGPLTEDGRLLYRLNTLYRHEDGFRDYDSDLERFFVAPVVSWQISEQTDFTVSLEYIRDDKPADFGLLAFGDGIADIPFDRVTNNPDATIDKDYLSVGYNLEHRFSEDWLSRNQFRYIANSYDYSVLTLPFLLDESTGILTRAFASQFDESDTYALYTNVQGEFDTGPLEHTLLFGVDLARTENESGTQFNTSPEFLTPLDIFDPDYSTPTPPLESLPIFQNTTSTTDSLGIYIQDQIDILDNLILVAGLRYDIVDQDTTNLVDESETNQYDDVVSPRVGIVYQPIEPISLYANYSRSFTPNFATDADGDPLEAEVGEGFEVGIRGEMIENRLTATFAYFDITKQNVATADPVIPFASVATGEQRSRGVDFNVTGEILPGWNVIASYAYVDAEITEDNTDIEGNRLRGVPEHSASLWTTYEIQSGDLQGLGFGLGLNFVGERQGDLANSFEADSYFLTNAAVFYRRDNWRAQVNIDNLFDIDYIESVGNSRVRGIYPGDPFTVRASVSYTF